MNLDVRWNANFKQTIIFGATCQIISSPCGGLWFWPLAHTSAAHEQTAAVHPCNYVHKISGGSSNHNCTGPNSSRVNLQTLLTPVGAQVLAFSPQLNMTGRPGV